MWHFPDPSPRDINKTMIRTLHKIYPNQLTGPTLRPATSKAVEPPGDVGQLRKSISQRSPAAEPTKNHSRWNLCSLLERQADSLPSSHQEINAYCDYFIHKRSKRPLTSNTFKISYLFSVDDHYEDRPWYHTQSWQIPSPASFDHPSNHYERPPWQPLLCQRGISGSKFICLSTDLTRLR